MDILIKGMEMPESCAKCKLFGEYGCPFIGAVGYALTNGKRNADCPLVPIQPHGRLIDADTCEDYFYEHLSDAGMAGAMNAIDEMPTIIPAERSD